MITKGKERHMTQIAQLRSSSKFEGIRQTSHISLAGNEGNAGSLSVKKKTLSFLLFDGVKGSRKEPKIVEALSPEFQLSNSCKQGFHSEEGAFIKKSRPRIPAARNRIAQVTPAHLCTHGGGRMLVRLMNR